MHVPKYLRDRLRDYDPHLRFRWSLEKKEFVLERKADRRFLPKPVRWAVNEDGRQVEKILPEGSDRLIQYRDGYIEILRTNCVTERLIHELYMRDAWRGAVDYIKRLEEKERQAEIKEAARHNQELSDISGESYDHLQWAGGSRVAV